jgi:hypothetical protein
MEVTRKSNELKPLSDEKEEEALRIAEERWALYMYSLNRIASEYVKLWIRIFFDRISVC